MIPLEPLALAGLLTAGFVAGLVDAMGGGGGLISVPAFLAAGVPPTWVLGTNKAMAFSGGLVSLIRYARAGFMPKFPRREWIMLITLCVVTSAMGAAVSTLPAVVENIKAWLPVMLVAVMAFLSKRWIYDEIQHKIRKTKPIQRDPKAPTHGTRAAVGAIACYDGLFGPGAGSFFLTYLEKHGYKTVTANALTKVLNLSSNVGALAWFAISGRILWLTGLLMACAFMAGNFLGSGIVIKRGPGWVRVLVLTSTTLLLVKFLSQN